MSVRIIMDEGNIGCMLPTDGSSDECRGDVDPKQGMRPIDIYDSLFTHNCKMCKEPLLTGFNAYEHDNGWHVKGYKHRLWLSLHCNNCNYDWSIWKLMRD